MSTLYKNRELQNLISLVTFGNYDETNLITYCLAFQFDKLLYR